MNSKKPAKASRKAKKTVRYASPKAGAGAVGVRETGEYSAVKQRAPESDFLLGSMGDLQADESRRIDFSEILRQVTDLFRKDYEDTMRDDEDGETTYCWRVGEYGIYVTDAGEEFQCDIFHKTNRNDPKQSTTNGLPLTRRSLRLVIDKLSKVV